MLKRKIIISFLLVFVLVTFAYAADAEVSRRSYGSRSFEKLGRGLHDICFCLLEIPHQVNLERKQNQEHLAPVKGFLRGIQQTALRGVVGFFEVVTFLVPQEAVLSPEYFFKS